MDLVNKLEHIDVKKTIIYSAIGISAIIGLIYVGKKVFDLVKVKDVNKEQRKLKKGGMELTLPLSSYGSIADNIYQAGFVIGGTDEDTIYAQLNKLNNDLDYLEVVKRFGKRREEFTWGTESDFSTFLHSELSASEISEANKILYDKGLTYTI